MKIEVTEAHIEYGLKANRCPICKAIRDKIPDSHVVVLPSNILVNRMGENVVVKTPQNVSDFIYKFDRRISVAPFNFEIWIE